jgi:hypothetical protein
MVVRRLRSELCLSHFSFLPARERMFGDGFIVRWAIGLDALRQCIPRLESQRIMPKTFADPSTVALIHCNLRTPPYKKCEFTLVLKGSPELTEEIADQLFEAGCDDGTPGTCDGVFSIDSFAPRARSKLPSCNLFLLQPFSQSALARRYCNLQ